MKQPKTRSLVGVLAVISLLFTACSGSSGSPSESAAAEPVESTAASAGASEEPTTGDLPEPELDTIRIGLNGTEASQFSLAAAEILGILEENGITAEVSTFEGDGQVAAALQAGQLDVVSIASAVPVSSQLTDAPMVALAVSAQVLTDQIVCIEGVETPEDVVGKRVAISTFGGTSNGAALLGVRAMGLTTDEVTITQVGGQGDRIAALEGGSVECAVVDANLQDEMEAQGFNILTDLKEEKVEWGRSVIAVSEEWLAENPNTALVVVASALAAQNMYWTDPEAMAEIYAEFNQIELADAEDQMADFQEIGNRSFMWTDGAFENPKEVLASVDPDIAEVDVTEAYDRSILEQLVDMGYYEKLGIPTE